MIQNFVTEATLCGLLAVRQHYWLKGDVAKAEEVTEVLIRLCSSDEIEKASRLPLVSVTASLVVDADKFVLTL